MTRPSLVTSSTSTCNTGHFVLDLEGLATAIGHLTYTVTRWTRIQQTTKV